MRGILGDLGVSGPMVYECSGFHSRGQPGLLKEVRRLRRRASNNINRAIKDGVRWRDGGVGLAAHHEI